MKKNKKVMKLKDVKEAVLPKETEIQKAERLIRVENQKKVNNCNQEIDAALYKYGFDIKINSNITLVPRIKRK